jgi:hypothetical protein
MLPLRELREHEQVFVVGSKDSDMAKIQIAEVKAMKINERGAIRAGVFVRFHPSRSEAGLLMYSECLEGGDPVESRNTLYRLKSAAGWRRKV